MSRHAYKSKGGTHRAGAPHRGAMRTTRPADSVDALRGLQATVGNSAVNDLLAGSHGAGRPLPPNIRRDMEHRFGRDFAAVRVHDDAVAADAAISLSSKAFTIGAHIVFGEGRFAPDTREGKHLIAHELTHVIQQSRGAGERPRLDGGGSLEAEARGAASAALGGGPVVVSGSSAVGPAAQPDAEDESWWPPAAEEKPLFPTTTESRPWYPLTPVQEPWKGPALEAEPDQLRAGDGKVVTTPMLVNWALRANVPPAELYARLTSSHEFSGSNAARADAAAALTLELRTKSLADRREERREEELMRIEVRRQQAEQAAKEAKRQERAEWLRGRGSHRSDLLERAHAPRQDRSGQVHFETYDRQGEVQALTYPSADSFGEDVRLRLDDIVSRCDDLFDEFKIEYRVDREVVDETFDKAAWYQKPGLHFVGLGYSKAAIQYGINSAKLCRHAVDEVKKAKHALDAGKGTPAAEGLNTAARRALEAKHWLGKMRREKEDDDESRLSTLQNTSKAGDYATMALGPVGQATLSITKNAGVRASKVHTDPNATFGVGDFLRESVADIAGAKTSKFLKGADPSLARTVASNVVGDQVTKAIAQGKPSALFDFDAMGLLFSAGGSLLERSGRSKGNAGAKPNQPPEQTPTQSKPSLTEPPAAAATASQATPADKPAGTAATGDVLPFGDPTRQPIGPNPAEKLSKDRPTADINEFAKRQQSAKPPTEANVQAKPEVVEAQMKRASGDVTTPVGIHADAPAAAQQAPVASARVSKSKTTTTSAKSAPSKLTPSTPSSSSGGKASTQKSAASSSSKPTSTAKPGRKPEPAKTQKIDPEIDKAVEDALKPRAKTKQTAKPKPQPTPKAAGIRKNIDDAKKNFNYGDKPGQISADVGPHKGASAQREATGVSGKKVQSAHDAPSSIMKQLDDYSRDNAITMLLEKSKHKSFDQTWKDWAQNQRRLGKKEATVDEIREVMAQAIDRAPITSGQKGALFDTLLNELHGTHGLQGGQKLDLPYPNVKPLPARERSALESSLKTEKAANRARDAADLQQRVEGLKERAKQAPSPQHKQAIENLIKQYRAEIDKLKK